MSTESQTITPEDSPQGRSTAPENVPIGKTKAALPRWLPVAISLVVLVALCALIAPRTLTPVSLGAMLPFAAILAIASVGQTFVVQQRGIDLSVGGTISLSAVLIAAGPDRHDFPLWLMVIVTLVICALIGLVNSLLVSRLLITPLVATLAMNALIMGVVLLYTGGSSSAVSTPLTAAVSLRLLGVPVLVWVTVGLVAALAFIAARTVIGRRLVLSGANPAAAYVSGLRVERNLVLAYVMAAVCYGVAGIFLAGYLENVTVNVGGSYLMSVIAVVIVGGTPLTGGRGTVVGTAIAAVFMSQLIQLVLTLGAPTATQMLIQALAIAIAAILSAIRPSGRKSERRRPKPV